MSRIYVTKDIGETYRNLPTCQRNTSSILILNMEPSQTLATAMYTRQPNTMGRPGLHKTWITSIVPTLYSLSRAGAPRTWVTGNLAQKKMATATGQVDSTP